MKVQQGIEYKIRNLTSLYNQGIIGQWEFARSMGYEKPDMEEPRQTQEGDTQVPSVSSPDDDAKKKKEKRIKIHRIEEPEIKISQYQKELTKIHE